MNIRNAAILILLILFSWSCTQDQKPEAPNIIYILADDMGIGDVKAYNADGKIPTPNIDRLASEGMMFMDAHTSSGVCTPTRYGILTGRYSWRTAELKQGVLGGHSPHLIDTNRETVASMLKKQGYATACFGKWHLGMDWFNKDGSLANRGKQPDLDIEALVQNGPLDIGFDHYYGIAGSLNMDPHAYVNDRLMEGTLEFLPTLKDVDERGFTQPSKPGWAAKEYIQEEVLATLAKNTCEWIRENADDPFFVYLPLPSPHSPIVPSDRFMGKSGLNLHGDFCMESDWVVGEVLNMLDELGLAENTIVIYTSDNGTSPKAQVKYMQEQGHYTVWKYRGLKGTLWEGGHRVPFLVRWPAKIKAGTGSDQTICTTDLFATAAEIHGLALEENAGEDSYSFLPALTGDPVKGAGERLIVHHSDKGVFGVRKGKWKLILDDKGGSNRRNPKDQPVINSTPFLLFDMENDEEESTNLYEKYPDVVDELMMEFAEVIESGRSNPGPAVGNDSMKEGDEWPQLSPLKSYMKENQ